LTLANILDSTLPKVFLVITLLKVASTS